MRNIAFLVHNTGEEPNVSKLEHTRWLHITYLSTSSRYLQFTFSRHITEWPSSCRCLPDVNPYKHYAWLSIVTLHAHSAQFPVQLCTEPCRTGRVGCTDCVHVPTGRSFWQLGLPQYPTQPAAGHQCRTASVGVDSTLCGTVPFEPSAGLHPAIAD